MGNRTAPESVEEENGMKQDWVTQKTFSAMWQLGALGKSSKGGAGTGPTPLQWLNFVANYNEGKEAGVDHWRRLTSELL